MRSNFYFGPRETIPIGHCFEWANRYVLKYPKKAKVVVKHGKIYDGNSNRYINHAWLEMDGLVYDYQIHIGVRKQVSSKIFDKIYRPIDVTAYTPEEVRINMLKYKNHGPWEQS